jgi:hypothetical protein
METFTADRQPSGASRMVTFGRMRGQEGKATMSGSIPPPSPEDFAALADAAGIALPAVEMAELQRAHASILAWIARVRSDWSYAEESAHQFAPPAAPGAGDGT